MIKMVYCLRRQPHLTPEQFRDYWLNTHGPLVRDAAGLLNIRRYVQHHPSHGELSEAMRASRGAPEPYDGVAEIWFDSVEAMQAPAKSPEARAVMRAIREDEATFIDQARSPAWLGEEHVLVQS
ncbi:MAG TPA: EthD domain-containing protein [bacterium]|nr:EthD domain-containing protein [bacterium]